ncbi:hypothetical protein FGG08_003839 [Glutinoglossum americanum]|uniref:Uncharacterized protein n=1 Tax=Glutinoglossum americanum TaxID=1670608 RepID=A0A9P8L394_9PEZI|nr:hypothetical protein FGG08_003839 [Glutinoglossum americanum]
MSLHSTSPASASTKYHTLSSESLEKGETDAFINDVDKDPESHHHYQPTQKHPWPWVFATLILSFLSLSLILKLLGGKTCPARSYETGFSSDLEAIYPAVGLQKVHFTGGLSLTENKTLFRETVPGRVQYAGAPNAEIDEAWTDLLRGLEVVLEGDEAKTVAGKTMEEPEGGKWRLSLDMYHSLHCVNEVRKALDISYYHPPSHPPPYFYRTHVDHCIDYLRQVVQCNADLTPLTYYRDEDTGATVPIFGAEHTCRDFGRLDEWALKRSGPI